MPQAQRSLAANAEVTTRTLAFSTSDYSGCGVAGCTSGLRVNASVGLVLAGLQGEHPRLVTKGGYDYAPAFSPDGALVAYFSRRRPSWVPKNYNVAVDDIALMTGTGRLLGTLVEPGKDASIQSLTWSPDSRSIAYVVTGATGRVRIVIRSVLTHHARTFALPIPLRELAWAPDGSSFVGVGARASAPGVTPTGDDLWLVSARTGKERRLTHFARGPLPFEDFCGNSGLAAQEVSEPTWSPDSRQIAFISSYAYAAVFGYEYDARVVNVVSGAVHTVLHPSPMRCLHQGVRYVMGSYRRVDVLGWT